MCWGRGEGLINNRDRSIFGTVEMIWKFDPDDGTSCKLIHIILLALGGGGLLTQNNNCIDFTS